MENGAKMLLAAILAAVGAYMRQLAASLLVLLCVMLLDYVSGIGSAWVNHRLSSRIGLLGIVKKVGYLLIVAVGMTLDHLIAVLGGSFGLTVNDRCFVGLLVIVWLIVNECISILENADEMGLPVPEFVKRLLVRLKRHTDEMAGEEDSPQRGEMSAQRTKRGGIEHRNE